MSRYFDYVLLILSGFLPVYSMHLNYTKLLSKEYFQIAMILFTFKSFDRHVNLNCFTSLSVSGRNDLHQSQPISGTLDPDVKDVVINFQAYCCILQDCFPVPPPSVNPVPRKRPDTYKYIALCSVTPSNALDRIFFIYHHCLRKQCRPPAQHFHTHHFTSAL